MVHNGVIVKGKKTSINPFLLLIFLFIYFLIDCIKPCAKPAMRNKMTKMGTLTTNMFWFLHLVEM